MCRSLSGPSEGATSALVPSRGKGGGRGASAAGTREGAVTGRRQHPRPPPYQVLQRFGLAARPPTPFSRGALVNVTLVLREDYVAHPRDRGYRRTKIHNPEELLAAIPGARFGVAKRAVRPLLSWT